MYNLRLAVAKKIKMYDDLVQQASTDNVAVQLMRDKKRWLFRNDLFYLLAATGHEKIAKWWEVYRPFCDEVSMMTWKVVQLGMHEPSKDMVKLEDLDERDLSMQRLYLCYRAFYKTTIITIGHSAQLLLNFPNIHVVLCHNKQDTSSKNLMAIKNLFLNKPKLSDETLDIMDVLYGVKYPGTISELFPEWIPRGKEWGSTEKFSLANRSDMQRPEESIEAKGVDTEITGGHWQVAKKNDLVTEKSVHTEEQIAKTFDWDARFNKGHFDDAKEKLQDYEGTRYHYNDLYSKKLEKEGLKIVTIPIVKDMDKFLAGDDGQIMHPGRYKREDILQMMEDDIWVFNCQMLLNPDDPAKKRFEPEMVQYYDQVPENIRPVLLVDPAGEKKKKSDYTAMVVVGVGVSHYYLLYVLRDKLGPDERIQAGIDLIKRYNIRDVGWEKIGLGNDTFYLEEKRRELGLNFSITEIKAHPSSKADRIRDILVPQYTGKKWLWPRKQEYYSKFHHKTIDMVNELRNEMLQFPNGAHDDMLDAKTFLMQMNVTKPREVKKEEYKGLTFGDLIKMTEERRERKLNQDPWERLKVSSCV